MIKKSSLKLNVLANYIGSGWNSLMTLIFVPYYIKYLGMEAYGLIGFYAMMQAALMLLDAGMTPTLNREMARFTGGQHTNNSIRNLLRTLEILCVSVLIAFYIFIWLSADFAASRWFQAQSLPDHVIKQAFLLIGLVAALRMIEGLYRGAIIGLQKQVTFNIANATMATLRGAGAVLILAFVQPTIQAYFVWQGIVSALTLALFAWIVYHELPTPSQKACFKFSELKSIWRFAAGVMVTSALALALTQIDKLILSRLLSLENFGNYSLVVTITSVLTMIIGPITQAHYPRLSELVSSNRENDLKSSFHSGAQLATVFSSCAAFSLLIYGDRIVSIWTGKPELGENIFLLLQIMTMGSYFNSLWHMPYVLQLSYGWSSFAARVNLVGVLFLVPAIFYFTPTYGAMGAAIIWLSLNAGYVLIASHFMFRRILPKEKLYWFVFDLAAPALASFSIILLSNHFKPVFANKYFEISYIVAAATTALLSATVVSPELRTFAKTFLHNFLKTNNNSLQDI